MQATAIVSTLRFCSPLRRVGPLFDKELRVASRQRRSYVLRFAYVSLLTILVAGAWFVLAPGGNLGAAVYQASRMGTAGRYIAMTLVWFQYVAAQVLAIVLLSRAIDEEIRKRTLPVLAVTPISGIQIVGGKLAGGLLHVIMLLAVSLPLLAVARVLGGVPGSYVISGVCITFAATVFTGALSLYPANLLRHKGLALIQVLWYLTLCRGLDGFIAWLARFVPALGIVGVPIAWINPTNVLLACTNEMLAARPSTGLSAWWPLHCLMLLAGSVVVLLWMARHIRTMEAAVGPHHTQESLLHRLALGTGQRATGIKSWFGQCSPRARPIQRVQGSAIVWKEMRKFAAWRGKRPLVRYGRPTAVVLLLAALVVSGATVMWGSDGLSLIAGVMAGWTFGLHVGLIVGLALAAASAIAKEREARTLPILLTIPWDDREIIKDEGMAVLHRGLPFLGPLLALSLVFLVLWVESSTRTETLILLRGVGLYLVGLLGIVPFLVGLGLYCGVRLKTAGGATVCLMVVAFGLFLAGFVTFNRMAPRTILSRPQIWLMVLVFMVFATLALAGAGWLLLWAASRRLRRNVF